MVSFGGAVVVVVVVVVDIVAMSDGLDGYWIEYYGEKMQNGKLLGYANIEKDSGFYLYCHFSWIEIQLIMQ